MPGPLAGRAASIDARAAAARAVDQVLQAGKSLDAALAEITAGLPAGRDRAQIRALAYGSLRWHCRHRAVLDLLLERPLRSRDRILEALLSVGLFELEFGRAPGYAAVSENVAAARRLGRVRAAGLVNASLRNYQRRRESLLATALRDEVARFAHPRWLLRALRHAWPAHWEAICNVHQQNPPMWLRVNRMQATVADYRRQLAESGITAEEVPAFPDALRLREPVDVAQLPGFTAGVVSVQDAASQVAAMLLGAEPGMRVLDACAAPGGKSLHLLERASGKLELHALDLDAARLERLRENLGRAGLDAKLIAGDAGRPSRWWDGVAYDRILVDAPCSATGVIRRHPDIRFLRRESDLVPLARRQLALLESLWPLLRPGGRLLYATCSVLPAENRDVGAGFLAATATASELRPLAGPVLDAIAGGAPGYQFLPHLAETDGFYYLVLQKRDA